MIQALDLPTPTEADYNTTPTDNPDVMAAIETATKAAEVLTTPVASAPAPVAPAPVAPTPAAPVATGEQSAPEPIIEEPLLQIDALPLVAAHLASQGLDIRDIGNGCYATMESIQNYQTLLGTHDSLSEVSIHEASLRAQGGFVPPGHHPINPMQNSGIGGALAPSHPTVLQPQPIGTIYEPKTSFAAAIQGLSARQIAVACGGGLAIIVTGIIVSLAVRGFESAGERELRLRGELQDRTAQTVLNSTKENNKQMADLSTKAMQKGNNSFCIGNCPAQKP